MEFFFLWPLYTSIVYAAHIYMHFIFPQSLSYYYQKNMSSSYLVFTAQYSGSDTPEQGSSGYTKFTAPH